MKNDVAPKQPGGEPKFGAKFWKLASTEASELAFYYCMPALVATDGSAMVGDALLTAVGEERALDQAMLSRNIIGVINQVSKFLHNSQLSGDNVKVVMPINADALTIEAVASAFTGACRDVLSPYNGQVIIEMMNFPAKLSVDYLDNLGVLVYPFCPQYIARPSPAWTDFKIFANCNFQGVSFDLKNKAWPIDKIQPHLEKFCQSANLNRLTPYLLGAATAEIQGSAMDLGFQFIAGQAVD